MQFCQLIGFQVWYAKLRNFHGPRVKALFSGTESSYSYLAMLLNTALNFSRISRPRPVLVTVITVKCTFLSELRNEQEQTENFSFYENILDIFVERKVCSFANKTWNLRKFHFKSCFFLGGGNKNEKLRNGLNLSLLLWIISLVVRFKFTCEQKLSIISKQYFLKKLKCFKFHVDSFHLKFTTIWQTFTHKKSVLIKNHKKGVSCIVILAFTSNQICTLQRYIKS